MYLLPKWVLTNARPSINDTESGTIMEQTAKIYGAMNELIEEYNTFADNINKIITDFTESTTQDQETFKIAIRQEFQDFIDVIEIKTQQQQTEIDNAVSYMQNNIVSTTKKIINDGITSGELNIVVQYDEATENLNIVTDGSV